MKAEPMMPNMSVTPLATMVSTKASDGVIFCTPATTLRPGDGGFLVMVSPNETRVDEVCRTALERPERRRLRFARILGLGVRRVKEIPENDTPCFKYRNHTIICA
jgi:hypothetical protein